MENFMTTDKTTLIDFLKCIPDPRIAGRTKHKLEEVIAIAVCAILSTSETCTDIEDWACENEEWLGKFLELPGGIPSHDTIGRVFSIIAPDAIQEIFYDWAKSMIPVVHEKNLIHIDGKFLRGSLVNNNCRTAVSLVTAWSSNFGLVLGMQESRMEKKIEEKASIAKLLDKLFLKDCIVTIDANGATPTILEKLEAQKAKYIIGLKGNQKALKNVAKKLIEYEGNKSQLEVFETEEKGHGRIEHRKYEYLNFTTCSYLGLKQIYERARLKWPNVKGFCKITSTRTVNKKSSVEERFYFTNLESGVNEIGTAIRSHWSIENTVHWTMDVVFREDYSRTRIKHAAANLGLVRRMALNLVKQEKTIERSMRRKLKLCSWNVKYLAQVIWGNSTV
jgi:predicted transposase YbfD/YdcC